MLMNKPNDFDEYAKNYKGHVNDALGLLGGDVSYYVERKVEILKISLAGQKIERILDYGCGIGQAVPFLKSEFSPAVIVGSDMSAESLSVASSQFPYLETCTSDQLPDGFFDLIFVSNVLHHVEQVDRSDVVNELCIKLRAGGKVAVFEHNPLNPITRRVVSNCVFDEGVELLSKSQVRKMLLNTGLVDKVSSGYCMFVPEQLQSLNWIERYLKILPIGGQHYTVGNKRAD